LTTPGHDKDANRPVRARLHEMIEQHRQVRRINAIVLQGTAQANGRSCSIDLRAGGRLRAHEATL